MRIGASLAMIAAGAILKFGITAHIQGLSVGVVGVVLMVVGAIGLLIALAFTTSRRRTDVVYRPDRVTYVEPTDSPLDRY